MKDPSLHDTLAENAAQCFLCLRDSEADALTKRRWRMWLSENPEHRRAVEACGLTWSAAGGHDLPRPAAGEIAADDYRGDAPIPLPTPNAASKATAFRIRKLPPRWMTGVTPGFRIGAVAAMIALVAIAAAEFPRNPRHDDLAVYATGRGEQRRLSLRDGSDVILGPESRLEVRVSPTERNFYLRTGEAIFSATHNPARPFRVYAGAGLVEDIGTAFAVRSNRDDVTVTVIQGEVVVSQSAANGDDLSSSGAHLTRNQQISYRDRLGPVTGVDATLATSWRNGQLSYIDAPLENVIAELRRYSMKDIVIEDQFVAGLRYTGTVSVNQIDQWAVGLARVYPVLIQISGDRLILREKPGDR